MKTPRDTCVCSDAELNEERAEPSVLASPALPALLETEAEDCKLEPSLGNLLDLARPHLNILKNHFFKGSVRKT